ncbi:MAG TPA: glycosyltransferase family 39 protein [Candidatus Limnocylindria bacterium]|nr:glycosyltransferase family 39 protein [Candidatus Limnocylindria bacterium]
MPRIIQWADGLGYDEIARMLVDKGTYGLQTLRPPGYPTVMAAVYAAFGKSLLTLRVVEAILGTIAVGLIGLIGSRWFGHRAGLLAATLAALHPLLAFLPSSQYSENVAVLAITLVLWTAFAAYQSGRWWQWAVAGALCGATTLIRPNVVTMFIGLAIGFAVVFLHERRNWLPPLVITACALILTVAPWIVRNHQVHDRWYFISSGGGRQFWFGNNPWTTGATSVLPQPDSAMSAHLLQLPNEFAQERYLYRKGVEFIREQPGRAARLYLVKLANLFALYPETLSRRFENRWSQGVQAVASIVIFAGALLGLSRARNTPAAWPLIGAVTGFALVNALFFGGLRYRMVIEPCLLLMAGLGWATVWERVFKRPTSKRC